MGFTTELGGLGTYMDDTDYCLHFPIWSVQLLLLLYSNLSSLLYTANFQTVISNKETIEILQLDDQRLLKDYFPKVCTLQYPSIDKLPVTCLYVFPNQR